MNKINTEIIKNEILLLAQKGDNDSLKQLSNIFNSSKGRILVQREYIIEIINRFVQTALIETEDKRRLLLDLMRSQEVMIRTDKKVKHVIFSIYSNVIDEELYKRVKECIYEGLSPYLFLVYIKEMNTGIEKTIINLSHVFYNLSMKKESILILIMANDMYPGKDAIEKLLYDKYIEFGMDEEAEKMINKHF